MKKCSKCKVEKEVIEFNKRTSNKDGLDSWCKSCGKESAQKRIKHLKENPTQETEKLCTICNITKPLKDFFKSSGGQYGVYSSCKKCVRERDRKIAQQNIINNKNNVSNIIEKKCYICEIIKPIKDFSKCASKKDGYHQMCKVCRGKSRRTPKQLKTASIYQCKRIKTNLKAKVMSRIRSRIRDCLKTEINGRKRKKPSSITQALGCSFEQLKDHLELRFYTNSKTGEQMTWDNYGFYGWHIDHIIPLSSFDLSDPEQFNKACHYTNLQPLWAEENLKKSSKIL